MKLHFHTTLRQRVRHLRHLSLIAFGVSFCALLSNVNGQGEKSTQASAEQKAKAHRDGQVWAALIFATDEDSKALDHSDKKSAKNGEGIKKTLAQLGKAFPGKNFQLLGEHTQQIFSEYESWVVPSKDLFLKIDSKGPTVENDGVNLHLQLWREKNVLLKTDIILRKEPLFITGPKWGEGRLIMVVELR